MGVPKFYRWTSERYPCLSEVINESQIPEFDNLYLDMNGIIHNCSHPNDDDITFRISEEEIFTNIFAYIENLYNLIKPQKVFFMAVDGVAPRAKMNQQRARRFMSARTAHTQMEKAIANGEVVPDEKRFDSNCITPGTYFMTSLHQKLEDWVKKKSVSDSRWHGRKIILSGHNVPGEGEHKIMDFIRTERSKSEYDPNTRHCMYGLDADLIMLGIVSHEPHFSLLREEVVFNSRPRKNDKNKKPKRTDSDVKTFHLLHLSLLREYLAWEFADVKESLPFAYDMERIVDDWIMMGLLVGNDFLPHLPSIHIHDDALPLLYSTYKKVLPTLDGYINESGYLNLARFEKFLAQLALNDKNSFMDKLEDAEFMESKRIRPSEEGSGEEELVAFESSDIEDEDEEDKEESGGNGSDDDAAFVSDHEEEDDNEGEKTSGEELSSLNSDALLLEEDFNDELATLALSGMNDDDFANNVEACWTKTINNQFKRHKKSYYSDKLRYKNISKAELREQAEGYVRAIQWNLHYYYHGCVSWSWFYPHHYAPFISDVQGFADMKIEFDLSAPFQPFEQLLAVLPEASADCLPRPLQELMSSDPAKSMISDFYPAKFETDLNGKRNDWEAVVLIPFIDEKRLLEAIESKQNRLSREENIRNTHGSHIQVISSRTPEGEWEAQRTELSQELFRIPKEQVKWGLLPNVKMDVYFPGFPTMKHLNHTGTLRFGNCNIFGMASRKESMILKVQNDKSHKDIIELGSELCDEEVCIDWPILKLAKVESIWGGDDKIVRKMDGDEIVVKDMTEEEKRQWQAHVNQISEHMMTRYAIEIAGQKDENGKHIRPALAWVRKFTGLVYETRDGSQGQAPVLKAVKQWSGPTSLVPVLLPLVVKDVLLENSRLLADLPVKAAFPLQSVVWLTDPKAALFGMPGLVSGYRDEDKPTVRVEVVGMTVDNKVERMEELRRRADQCSLRWMAGFECSRQCQVDVRFFSRITGTMMLWNEPRKRVEKGQQLSSDSKINCGMGLKYSRRDVCLADFTDRIETTNNKGITAKTWFYSPLVVTIAWEYKKKFPELWSYLESAGSNQVDDVYYAEEVWTNEEVRNTRFNELKEFLSGLPSQEAEQLKCGTEYADRRMITEIEKTLKFPDIRPRTMSKLFLPPASLFRFELYDGKVQVDPEADFLILDRVALMCPHSKIPKVVQGTVIGIHDDKIDVLFDLEFEGGAKVRNSTMASAYRAPRTALFNVTYGLKRKVSYKKELKKQEALALDGAYVPMKQKHSKQQEAKPKNHWEAPKPAPNSKSQKKEKNSKKEKKVDSTENQKNSKKEKKLNNVVMAKRKSEDTPEALTDSLNKLLNIKSKKLEPEVAPASEEPTSSGKSVTLMELLGGSGAKKTPENTQIPKKPHGSKSLEEIEADASSSKETKKEDQDKMASLLQQLSNAQNGQKKNQKNWQKKDEGWWQKKNDNAKNSKSSKNTKDNKNQNQKQKKVEILRKPSQDNKQEEQAPQAPPHQAQRKKTPSPPLGAHAAQGERVKTPSPPLANQSSSHSYQQNLERIFPEGIPYVPLPAHFQPPSGAPLLMTPMGVRVAPMGMPMMHPMAAMPMHPNFPPQNMGYDGRRPNPTLTDFKPSVISRNSNHRATNQPPKVTMITKRKSVTPPLPFEAPEENPKPVEKVEESSAPEEKVKKPRKKKQSRLAVNFCNPSPSS